MAMRTHSLAGRFDRVPPVRSGEAGGVAVRGATTIEKQPAVRTRTKPASSWNVVLLDDDDHTYEYVVEMLGAVCGHSWSKAWAMAREVDGSGRAIVWSGEREVAEFKQERIHAYGADPRLERSKGSMTAVVERAS